MNKVVLCGRITRKPEIRYANNGGKAVCRFTLAVDRRGKDNGTDFVNCVSFDKSAEFAEKWFDKGTKVIVTGHLMTGSYTNKDGQKVNTTDVVIEEQEFAESKRTADSETKTDAHNDDFMSIPDDVDDAGLPWN